MRRLPELAIGPNRYALPMADHSAAVLVEAILSAGGSQPSPSLTEPLMSDPPLVLWAVCRAAQEEPWQPRSVQQVAQWLQEHALEQLQWGAERAEGFDTSADPRREEYAALVAARLELADLAALLAVADGQSAAEEAYLAGLLHDPGQWWALVSGSPRKSASEELPAWWGNLCPEQAVARVTQALGLLAGETPAPPADFDREFSRRRAEEGRRAWLEAVAGPGSRLPELTARLARLEQLEHRFQQTLESEKLAAMAEFAAGAGHEINNPLAIIGGRAQLLLKEETDAERRRELALVNAQVKRAHEMIADMRLFARPPQPQPETVDLVELIDSLIADLDPQAAERAISLSFRGEQGPLEIEADPAQFQVALRALCNNALEAIGHSGQIEIALARSDKEVEIRVSDDGPGILPEDRRHLFDPFYSARQAGRGLGLGLSKCWRIVTGHGGRIEVQSEPGQGAVFTLTLPLRQP